MNSIKYNTRLYGVSFSERQITLHYGRRYIQIYLTKYTPQKRNKINRIKWRVPDAEQCEYELTHSFNPWSNFFGYIKEYNDTKTKENNE